MVPQKKILCFLFLIFFFLIFFILFRSQNISENFNNNLVILYDYDNFYQDYENFNFPIIKLPKNINNLVDNISKYYSNFDSFIIITNIDNISTTSASLSFLLENINKNVVVSNDLYSSLIFSNFFIPEVVVIFDKKIIKGSKIHNNGSSIVSYNFPYIGYIKNQDIFINYDLIFPISLTSFNSFNPLYFNPNKIITYIKNYDFTNLDSKISDVYIIGNFENIDNRIIMDKIKDLVENKGVIFLSNDKKISSENFVIYSDSSPEVMYAKINLIISNVHNYNYDLVKKLFNMSLRGE